MRDSMWKRSLRKALAVLTAVALFASLTPTPAAAAGCTADQLTATYYTKNAAGDWVEASTACVAVPTGSFSPTLPAKIGEESTYKVVYTGTLKDGPGWFEFAITSNPTVTVDGMNPASALGSWIQLESQDTLRLEYIRDSSHTSFTVAWSAAGACTDVIGIYRKDGSSERQAAAVTCEARPTESSTGVSSFGVSSFPAAVGSGSFTASYTGSLEVETLGWYEFEATVPAADSLRAQLDLEGSPEPEEELFPDPAAEGYLELKPGSYPFAVQYVHASGTAGFTMDWSVVTCETGSFLAAYFDKPNLKGRANRVRCEALPGGARVPANSSARWNGQLYFDAGAHSFKGVGDLTIHTTPEQKLTLTGTGQALTGLEGLQEMTLEVKNTAAESATVDLTITDADGVTLAHCLDGAFMQELSVGGVVILPRTCVPMPTEGPPAGQTAKWTGRVWFQGGEYTFIPTNLTNVQVDGAAADGLTLSEGRHHLSFAASSTGSVALDYRVVGGCPDGTYRSEYTAGGVTRFGGCEARPDYAWPEALPPGVSDDFTATWRSRQMILDGGLYQFAATATAGTVDLTVGASSNAPAQDLSAGTHDVALTYANEGAPAAVSLQWHSPATGSEAPACPQGLYLAEYFATDDLSGQPYLRLCERKPDLTHLRPWMTPPQAVRWSGQIPLEAGTYTFTTTVGGEAALYVDTVKLTERSAVEGLDVHATSWSMVRGLHAIQLEWRNTGALPFARLRLEGSPADPCPAGEFKLTWYTNADMTTKFGPDGCEGGAPMHEWGSLEPVKGIGDSFAATWTSTIDFPKGRYRFYVQALGGVRFQIDGESVFVDYNPEVLGGYRAYDLWSEGPQIADAEVELDGEHVLSISYAKNPLKAAMPPSGAALKLWWEPAGAPVLTGAKLQGTNLVLTYSDALDGRTKPGPDSFTVFEVRNPDAEGEPTTQPVAVTATAISNDSLTLTLDSAFDGDQVIVRYDPSRGASLRAQTLSSRPARNVAAGKTPDTTVGWLLDLEAVYLLSQVKVHADSDAYTVALSTDGTNFATVTSFSTMPAARWIRLSPTGAALPAIAAVEAWGVEPGAPALLPAPVAGVNPSNLALGKVAAMGVGEEIAPAEGPHSAAYGVNGHTTRRIENREEIWDYFATDLGLNPWWRAELGDDYLLTGLRIFNREDADWEEAASLEVWVSTEVIAPAAGSPAWAKVYPTESGGVGPFGGSYSPYLRIDLASVPARHVMLRLSSEEEKRLHLAEVEVLGVRATPSLIVYRDSEAPALSTEQFGGVVRPRLHALDDYVILRFNEDLNPSALPDPDHFQVSVDGTLVTPASVQVYQRDVTLYLAPEHRTDPSMLVGARYTGEVIADLSGNPADPIDFTEAKYLAITPQNLAFGRETAMSSTDGAHSADKGVNDYRYYDPNDETPDYFRTNSETDPWWLVDLEGVYSLEKIRIFNRIDGGWANVAPLQIQLATACTNWAVGACSWETVYDNAQQNGGTVFGAVEGSFLSVTLAYNNARYVRVRLPGSAKQLNLSEVQVYGVPAVQIFNVGSLRPATLDAQGGIVTQLGGYYPVPGEVPPAGMAGESAYSPALANDTKSDTYTHLLAKPALDAACDCLWLWKVDLQSTYLLTGLRLTLDPTQVDSFLQNAAIAVSADAAQWTDLFPTGGQTWSDLPPAVRPLVSGGTVTIQIPAREARYLRILSRSMPELKLYEAEVLGFPPSHLATDGKLTNLSRERPATIDAKAGLYTQWFDRYLTDPPAFENLDDPAYNPAWAVDGNSATYAELRPKDTLDAACDCKLAWSVDLQAEYEVLRAVITLSDNAAAVDFLGAAKIQIKVGETWTEVDFTETGLVDGNQVILPLPGLKAQQVRITATTIDLLQLREVDIYGYALELEP